MMPEMDGVEATKRIRARPGGDKVRIVALTANAVYGMREFFIDSGMDDFISKPIDQAELNQVLLRWLPPETIEVTDAPAPQGADVWSHTVDVMAPMEAPRMVDPLSVELTVAGIDADAAMRHLGSVRQMRLYVHEFDRSFDGYMDTLEKTLANGDLAAYRVQIHALKGIMATLGCDALAEQALSLEEAAKAGRLEECQTGNGPATEAFRAFREQLRTTSLFDHVEGVAVNTRAVGAAGAGAAGAAGAAPGDAGGADPGLGKQIIVEKLEALYRAARSGNLGAVTAAAETLRGLADPPRDLDDAAAKAWAERWPVIDAHLGAYQLTRAAEAAGELLRQMR